MSMIQVKEVVNSDCITVKTFNRIFTTQTKTIILSMINKRLDLFVVQYVSINVVTGLFWCLLYALQVHIKE